LWRALRFWATSRRSGFCESLLVDAFFAIPILVPFSQKAPEKPGYFLPSYCRRAFFYHNILSAVSEQRLIHFVAVPVV